MCTCPRCGNRSEKTIAFCPNCGTRMVMAAPPVGYALGVPVEPPSPSRGKAIKGSVFGIIGFSIAVFGALVVLSTLASEPIDYSSATGVAIFMAILALPFSIIGLVFTLVARARGARVGILGVGTVLSIIAVSLATLLFMTGIILGNSYDDYDEYDDEYEYDDDYEYDGDYDDDYEYYDDYEYDDDYDDYEYYDNYEYDDDYEYYY